MTTGRRGALTCAAIAVALALPTAAAANRYTLDGAETSQDVARDAICAAFNFDDPGTTVCFSSWSKVEDAAARARREGRVPPGEGPAAKGKASRKRRPTAKASHHCGRDYNNIWTGGNYNDNHAYYGNLYYGIADFGYPHNNNITSYKHAHFYTDLWDGFGGTGSYYSGGWYPCEQAQSLATGNPAWNNRFSSVSTHT